MKKGVVGILTGIVLIVIQLMSVMGNIKAGTPLPSIQGPGLLMVYDLFSCFGFYLIGIVVILLLVIGKFQYENSDSNSEENADYDTVPVISKEVAKEDCVPIIKNPKQTVLYCFVALLLFISLALAISTFTLVQKVNDLSKKINTLTAQMEEMRQQCEEFTVAVGINDMKHRFLDSEIDEINKKIEVVRNNTKLNYHKVNHHKGNVEDCFFCYGFSYGSYG